MNDAKTPLMLKLEAVPVNVGGLVEAATGPLGDAAVEILHPGQGLVTVELPAGAVGRAPSRRPGPVGAWI
jgi:hypothetical protein